MKTPHGRFQMTLGKPTVLPAGCYLLTSPDCCVVCYWFLFPGAAQLPEVSYLSRLLGNLCWWKKMSGLRRKGKFLASMRAMPSISMLPPLSMYRRRNSLRWVKTTRANSREHAVSMMCYMNDTFISFKGLMPLFMALACMSLINSALLREQSIFFVLENYILKRILPKPVPLGICQGATFWKFATSARTTLRSSVC